MNETEETIKAGYVLRDIEALQKMDDPAAMLGHLQAWADGPEGLRKSVATSFMEKAKKTAAEKPGSAVARWSAPGAVKSGAAPDMTGAGAGDQARADAHKQMDAHAKRFAHVARRAAVWGASLGAAAALSNQRRTAAAHAGPLAPRNPLTGAPAAPAGAMMAKGAGMRPRIEQETAAAPRMSAPRMSAPAAPRAWPKPAAGGVAGRFARAVVRKSPLLAAGAALGAGALAARRWSKGRVAKADGADVLEQPLAKAHAMPRMSRPTHTPDAPMVPGQDPTPRQTTKTHAAGPSDGKKPATQPGPGFTPRDAETGSLTHATTGDAAPHPSENPSTPDAPLVPTQEATPRVAAKTTPSPLSARLTTPKPGPGFTPRDALTGKLSGKKNAQKGRWVMSKKAMR